MNRIEFWILIVLSALVAVFLGVQAIYAKLSQHSQLEVIAAQQTIQEGQASETRRRQLAVRIYQVAQQNQDQTLRDLLTRQGITIKVNPTSDASAPPAAGSAPTTH
jgi:hypothetical protein